MKIRKSLYGSRICFLAKVSEIRNLKKIVSSRIKCGRYLAGLLFVCFKILFYRRKTHFDCVIENQNWAASWQNQQNDCAPSEYSDQPWHPPSLIRVFAVRMKKAWVLSYPMSAQRRLRSDWVDAQADLSLRWAHRHFVGFVTRRLKFHFF